MAIELISTILVSGGEKFALAKCDDRMVAVFWDKKDKKWEICEDIDHHEWSKSIPDGGSITEGMYEGVEEDLYSYPWGEDIPFSEYLEQCCDPRTGIATTAYLAHGDYPRGEGWILNLNPSQRKYWEYIRATKVL